MPNQANSGKAHHLLARKDYRRMEWKNGKGITEEIVIYPPDSSISAGSPFLWRLSMAEVRNDGPFSEFPGYERFLTLVEGKGIRLRFAKDGKEALIRKGEIHRFSGDQAVACELLAGPVIDLGLIFRSKDVTAEFAVLEFDGKPRSFSMDGRMALLFALSGTVAASIYPGEDKYTLRDADTLQVEGIPKNQGERLILLEPQKPKCRLAWIEVKY